WRGLRAGAAGAGWGGGKGRRSSILGGSAIPSPASAVSSGSIRHHLPIPQRPEHAEDVAAVRVELAVLPFEGVHRFHELDLVIGVAARPARPLADAAAAAQDRKSTRL